MIPKKKNCTICMIVIQSSAINKLSTEMTIYHNYETGEVTIKL